MLSPLPTDDGKIFHGSGVGDPFGPRCYKGDIMGCGIMFPRDYILDSEGEWGGANQAGQVEGGGSTPGAQVFWSSR